MHPLAYTGYPLTQISDALFWDTIFSIDVASAEGLSNIRTLVHSPSKIAMARSLQDDQAQRFIDIIDQVSSSSKRPLVPRMLIVGRSFSRYHALTRNYLGGAHGCFTRSAKLAGYYLPHTSFNQSSPILVSLDGAAALQT